MQVPRDGVDWRHWRTLATPEMTLWLVLFPQSLGKRHRPPSRLCESTPCPRLLLARIATQRERQGLAERKQRQSYSTHSLIAHDTSDPADSLTPPHVDHAASPPTFLHWHSCASSTDSVEPSSSFFAIPTRSRPTHLQPRRSRCLTYRSDLSRSLCWVRAVSHTLISLPG